MTWNHRIIRKKVVTSELSEGLKNAVKEHYGNEGTYEQIHEVYYNKDGSIMGATKNPMAPYGNNTKELKENWHMMGSAFDKPVLIEIDHDKFENQ